MASNIALYNEGRVEEIVKVRSSVLLSGSPGSLGGNCEGSEGKGQHPANLGAGEVDPAEWEEHHRKFPRGIDLNRKPRDSYVAPALMLLTNIGSYNPSHSPRQQIVLLFLIYRGLKQRLRGVR